LVCKLDLYKKQKADIHGIQTDISLPLQLVVTNNPAQGTALQCTLKKGGLIPMCKETCITQFFGFCFRLDIV
jgi:hypothetical protein